MCSVYVHMCEDAHGAQKRVLGPQELKLQAGVNCPVWVLRTELRSSGRKSGTLNCQATSPDLQVMIAKADKTRAWSVTTKAAISKKYRCCYHPQLLEISNRTRFSHTRTQLPP